MFERVIIFTFVIFPAVCIVGYGLELVFVKQAINHKLGPFNPIIKMFFYIGVIAHELCHLIMNVITGVPVKSFKARYSDKRRGVYSPHGSVAPSQPRRLTFLQSLLGGLAPLLIMTWLFFFFLEIAVFSSIDPLFRILAGIYSFCLVLALCPSQGDFRFTTIGFFNDPKHSVYQISLLVASFLLVWLIVELYQLYLPFEFLYYFIIVFGYVILKYFLKMCYWFGSRFKIRKPWKREKLHYKNYTRRRYKPIKPKKIGIKETQR